jgi:hypothetical protein
MEMGYGGVSWLIQDCVQYLGLPVAGYRGNSDLQNQPTPGYRYTQHPDVDDSPHPGALHCRVVAQYQPPGAPVWAIYWVRM